MEHALYVDGGCIGRNPSDIGGTYGGCHVEGGLAVEEWGDGFSPDRIGVREVTNNHAELVALLVGLARLPAGWRGAVCSDSRIALGWVFEGFRQDRIPPYLQRKLAILLRSGVLEGLEPILVQGHPTRADLLAGIGKKRGLPVSIHNVRCDDLCREAARRAGYPHAADVRRIHTTPQEEDLG